MKIACISDTHSKHHLIPKSWLDNEDNKISTLVHAGDISMMGYIPEVKSFCDWFSKLPFDNLLFCAGNHDWSFEPMNKNHEACMDVIKSYKNIHYLIDEEIIIDGVKFYFSPQTPYFYNWAFNCARNENEAEMYKKPLIKPYWDKIPDDVEVLVTHGPVFGVNDFVVQSGKFVGCKDLLDTVSTRLTRLKLHVCGHIHYSYGIVHKDNHITFVNASIANERYEMVNEPIIIEI